MVRYIKAVASPNHVFDVNDTKVSHYNNFLNPKDLAYMEKSKNRTGEIVQMTPEDYFRECAENIFHVSLKHLKDSRAFNADIIEKYASDMEQGDTFPLPYINYADKAQEGLHRMMAAGEAFGWNKKFPVLVVKAFDDEYEAQKQNFDNMRDYERHDFKMIVEQAKDEISDWDNMAPPDVLTQFRTAIIKAALNPEDPDIESNNIDVEVEAEDRNGGVRLHVYLTEFNGYEEDRWAGSEVTVWLDDMFDLSESPFEAADYD